jgi:predicted nucleotidyltransferase
MAMKRNIAGKNFGQSRRSGRNEVIQTLKVHLPELREHYGVNSLWIFGSYVRDEQSKRSDLDVLVEFGRTPSLFEFVRLERHLSELLKMKVDLVMKRALKPAIGRHILEEAHQV